MSFERERYNEVTFLNVAALITASWSDPNNNNNNNDLYGAIVATFRSEPSYARAYVL